MRKASPLLALIMLALAAPARAQEPAAVAPAPAPPADPPAVIATPAPASAPVATVVADTPPAPVVTRRKLQVGLSFLPMAMGRFTYLAGTKPSTVDMRFAYGLGLSAGYEVLPGLVVGLAPQVIFNVQPKPLEFGTAEVARQYDLMARVAYELRPVETIAVYAEVLPGFSRVVHEGDASPSSGLVLAFGLGCAADLTDRFFMNLGAGYQLGYQNQPGPMGTQKERTNYVRVALGGGVRF
jgi:hypothetical protein